MGNEIGMESPSLANHLNDIGSKHSDVSLLFGSQQDCQRSGDLQTYLGSNPTGLAFI
jgi:hypothetical protein